MHRSVKDEFLFLISASKRPWCAPKQAIAGLTFAFHSIQTPHCCGSAPLLLFLYRFKSIKEEQCLLPEFQQRQHHLLRPADNQAAFLQTPHLTEDSQDRCWDPETGAEPHRGQIWYLPATVELLCQSQMATELEGSYMIIRKAWCLSRLIKCCFKTDAITLKL